MIMAFKRASIQIATTNLPLIRHERQGYQLKVEVPTNCDNTTSFKGNYNNNNHYFNYLYLNRHQHYCLIKLTLIILLLDINDRHTGCIEAGAIIRSEDELPITTTVRTAVAYSRPFVEDLYSVESSRQQLSAPKINGSSPMPWYLSRREGFFPSPPYSSVTSFLPSTVSYLSVNSSSVSPIANTIVSFHSPNSTRWQEKNRQQQQSNNDINTDTDINNNRFPFPFINGPTSGGLAASAKDELISRDDASSDVGKVGPIERFNHSSQSNHNIHSSELTINKLNGSNNNDNSKNKPSSSFAFDSIGQQQQDGLEREKVDQRQRQSAHGDLVKQAHENQLNSIMVTNKSRAFLSCDTGDMIIELNFSEPFRGIVYANNDRLTPCKLFGNGLHHYELRVPLRGCGTKQEGPRLFMNDIIIRFHRSLELEEDEVKTIVCRYPPPMAPPPSLIPQGLPERIVEGPKAAAKLIYFDPLFIISVLLFCTLLLASLGFGALAMRRRASGEINQQGMNEPRFPIPPSIVAQKVYDSFVDTESSVEAARNSKTLNERVATYRVVSKKNVGEREVESNRMMTDETFVKRAGQNEMDREEGIHIKNSHKDQAASGMPKYTIKNIEDIYTTKIDEIDRIVCDDVIVENSNTNIDNRNNNDKQHHQQVVESSSISRSLSKKKRYYSHNNNDWPIMTNINNEATTSLDNSNDQRQQKQVVELSKSSNSISRRSRISKKRRSASVYKNLPIMANNNDRQVVEQSNHISQSSSKLPRASVYNTFTRTNKINNNNNSLTTEKTTRLSKTIVTVTPDGGEQQLNTETVKHGVEMGSANMAHEWRFKSNDNVNDNDNDNMISISDTGISSKDEPFVSMRPTLTSPEQFKRLQTIVDIFDEIVIEHRHNNNNSNNQDDNDYEIVYETRPRPSKYRSSIQLLSGEQRATLRRLLTTDENFRSLVVECTTQEKIRRKLRHNTKYRKRLNRAAWNLLTRVLIETDYDDRDSLRDIHEHQDNNDSLNNEMQPMVEDNVVAIPMETTTTSTHRHHHEHSTTIPSVAMAAAAPMATTTTTTTSSSAACFSFFLFF